MDWPTYALARQYLVEERIGSPLREAKALEEQQAKAARQTLESRR
jgi:hypothetical protein